MLDGIKSLYILKEVFFFISNGTLLRLLHHNKKFQKKLEIRIEDFQKYSNQIVIDIIPEPDFHFTSIFINLVGNPSFFHIYFNEDLKDKKRNFIYFREKVPKIRVIIEEDKEMKSLKGLFASCFLAKEINFIKFNRRDITDMSDMFQNSNNLIKIDISKLKTDSVTTMENMFKGCSKLKTIDLSNFKECNSLDKTNNMFYKCSSLVNINLSNLEAINLKDMSNL
jgi:surface protein